MTRTFSPDSVLAPLLLLLTAPCLSIPAIAADALQTPSRIELRRDDARQQLAILVDGKESMVYQYGSQWDMAHFYPVRSPSGKLLTVQKTEPYPHHRSIWFADTVQLAGHRRVSFYMALNSPRVDPQDPNSPHVDRIRHAAFLPSRFEEHQARFGMQLVWEMDKDVPVLDEKRDVRVVALNEGEYFVDLAFKVTAGYGDVQFLSDWSHYAWPYVRMHSQFSEQSGGRMSDSAGRTGEPEIMGKTSMWVDYSNAVDGVTEGLAIFSHDDNEQPHKWFTRGYGTFGPRRTDDRSGKPFTLKRGESLVRRVGLLVHRGDAQSGRVGERYQKYIAGEL